MQNRRNMGRGVQQLIIQLRDYIEALYAHCSPIFAADDTKALIEYFYSLELAMKANEFPNASTPTDNFLLNYLNFLDKIWKDQTGNVCNYDSQVALTKQIFSQFNGPNRRLKNLKNKLEKIINFMPIEQCKGKLGQHFKILDQALLLELDGSQAVIVMKTAKEKLEIQKFDENIQKAIQKISHCSFNNEAVNFAKVELIKKQETALITLVEKLDINDIKSQRELFDKLKSIQQQTHENGKKLETHLENIQLFNLWKLLALEEELSVSSRKSDWDLLSECLSVLKEIFGKEDFAPKPPGYWKQCVMDYENKISAAHSELFSQWSIYALECDQELKDAKVDEPLLKERSKTANALCELVHNDDGVKTPSHKLKDIKLFVEKLDKVKRDFVPHRHDKGVDKFFRFAAKYSFIYMPLVFLWKAGESLYKYGTCNFWKTKGERVAQRSRKTVNNLEDQCDIQLVSGNSMILKN
jgi:hypothetical protein